MKTEYEDHVEYTNELGQFHREDGPAVEWADGAKKWFINGRRHREGGPAVEWANGDKEWYINGKRHREDGPAIEGIKYWFLKYWFLDDEFHGDKKPDNWDELILQYKAGKLLEV